MHYLISGGSGFIGRPLVTGLLADGHRVTVLTRDYARARLRMGSKPTLVCNVSELAPETDIDVMINLAGAGIADRRWTNPRKRVLMDSRVKITRQMVDLIQRLRKPPLIFVSASAIGFYGASDDRPLRESDPAVTDEFTHELCKRWEAEALRASALGVRTVITRFGIVLGKGGGMIARLNLPFRLGLGGRLGSGEQILSWVHRDDVIAAIRYLIADEQCDGVFNVTAPEAVSNAEFTRALARVLRRPAVFPMPVFVVCALFGEMGERLLLRGQRVVPHRLTGMGFRFAFPTVEPALAEATGSDAGNPGSL